MIGALEKKDAVGVAGACWGRTVAELALLAGVASKKKKWGGQRGKKEDCGLSCVFKRTKKRRGTGRREKRGRQ
jgi:hypothetical protein